MKRYIYSTSFILLMFFSLKSDAQVLGVSECFNENDAFIGLDRKAWTSQTNDLSESYQIDFQIPEEPPFECFEIEYIDISINLNVNQNDITAECFLGFWTHVLNSCDNNDPIGCSTDDIYFDMMGLNSSITLTDDLENGNILGIDVVVLTVATNPACSQTAISDGDFDADLEICVEVYYVPKEIDEEIDLGDDITICPGETIDIEGPDGFEEYSWDGPVDSDEQLLEDAIVGEYTLDVFDEDGCRISDDIIVLEEPAFDLSIDNPLPVTLCEGNAITLTAIVNGMNANPDYEYIWLQNQTFLSANPVFNIDSPGNYSLIATSMENSCSQTLNFPINTNNLSLAQIDSISLDSIFLCKDTTIQLNAFVPFTDTNNYTFQWISANDTLIQDSLLVNESGQYILNQFNDLGCPSSSDSIIILFNGIANAGMDNSIDLCQGNKIELENLLSAQASPNGAWESNPLLNGVSSGSIETSDVNPGEYTLLYIVEGIEPCPSDTSRHIITILDAQLNAGDDITLFFCVDDQYDLSNFINGDSGGDYYDSNFTLLTSPVIQAADLQSDSEIYYYVVENQICSPDTALFLLESLPEIPVTAIEDTICANDIITIAGFSFGMNNPEGTINLNSVGGCDSIISIDLQFFEPAISTLSLELCNGQSYSLNGQVFDENNPSGTVILEDSSINGCDSLIDVSLNFSQVLSDSINETLCEGEEITINGTIYNEMNPSGVQSLVSVDGCDSLLTVEIVFVSNSDSLLQFEICEGDDIIINGVIYNELNPSSVQSLSGVNGCDSLLTVDVFFTPNSDSLLTLELCEGDQVEINGATIDMNNNQVIQTLVSATGCDSILSIQASLLNISEEIISEDLCEGETLLAGGELFDMNNNSGQVILENMNQFGCDSIINVALNFFQNDQEEINYEFCDGDSIEINGVWITDAGTYENLFQNQNGCDSLVSSIVTLIDCEVTISIDVISQVDCFEGEGSEVVIVFNEYAIGLNYQVLNENGIIALNGPIVTAQDLVIEDLPAGIYEFRILDNGIIETNDFFEITQPDALIHNALISDLDCFNGMSGLVSLDISGGTPIYSVSWDNGQSGTELNQLEAGTYSYTITDANDCQVFGSVELQEPSVFDLDLVVQDASCEEAANGQITIENISGGTAPFSYSLNGSSFQSETIFGMLSPDDYTLFVSDDNDCQYEFSFAIMAENNLELTLASSISYTDGDEVMLNASINFNSTSIMWSNPAILSCSDCLNPILTASQSTQLDLTVTDENGCEVSASIDITVLPNLNNEIYIPNIIQLNSFDPANDRFLPSLSPESTIEFTEMRIYDRWGNEVYNEAGGNIIGWDGRYNDVKVIPGVYVYQMLYIENGEEKALQGQLTVIR